MDPIENQTRAPEVDASAAAHAAPFWADAWARAVRRPGARVGLGWLAVVALLAVFAPVLANGRPLVYRELNGSGSVVRTRLPLLERLTAADLVLVAGGMLAVAMLATAHGGRRRARVAGLLVAGAQAAVTVAIVEATKPVARPEAWLPAADLAAARLAYGLIVGAVVGVVFLMIPAGRWWSVVLVAGTALVAGGAGGYAWNVPLRETRFAEEAAAGRARAYYTVIPFSPDQGGTERSFLPPGSGPGEVAAAPAAAALRRLGGATHLSEMVVTAGMLDEVERAVAASGLEPDRATAISRELRTRWNEGRLSDGAAVVDAIRAHPGPRHVLGTDAFGGDVLSQVLHACRLSISIGLVSTGIAVVIGVTVGALMGYFGGVVDLVLSRVVEVVMAVPLLFLLVVVAGVLPPELRGPYTMMAVIGCFTWTGAARFTRAEFLKLRTLDFVQSARALGLPARSVLFRHMLPNGVTPVLVEASFGVAAAITIEATLSYLGLGPVDHASWGRLLSGAYDGGGFRWWLAAFPGGAILLTVLSYNFIGEALRDAMDPRIGVPR